MKKIVVFVSLVLSSFVTLADEGMWLPQLLKEFNEADMKKIGCKLTPEQIFSINNSSLKDAIVQFGGGCTGELVSDEGLLLTNHHCGYPYIQQHSSVDHDYLKNGFWAKNKSEEIITPGLTAMFVIRIEDVTKKVLTGVNDNTTEEERNKIVEANIKAAEAEAVKGTGYQAKIKPYFYGNEYYMLVTETFKDVRLVGTPPEFIGRFGGDTDNWMWPRHTGDFSVFRIYANEKNEPAEYAQTNKPYKPRKALTVSLKGYKQGDFTMTYGFPGRTHQYLTSQGIELVYNYSNPLSIKARGKRLDIWDADMKASDKVRIQYASKYARISNYYKKYQGENKGMRIMNTLEMKRDLEKQFAEWSTKTGKYQTLLNDFKQVYDKLTPLQAQVDLYSESGMGIEIVAFANKFNKLVKLSKDKAYKEDKVKEELTKLKEEAAKFFKDYNAPTDKKVLAVLLQNYNEELAKTNSPLKDNLTESKYNGKYDELATSIFKESFLVNENKVLDFLNSYKASSWKKLEKDPAFKLMQTITNNYKENIAPNYEQLNTQLNLLYRTWTKALREMQPTKSFWPDANSTMRIAYGTVEPYKPFDGANYDYKTTLTGIIEKMDNTNPEFVVPQKLVDLYNKKDFGSYAENGDVPVAFIATNHTTGGNSGSPLLDGEGRLLGLNFDTGWEGTMSNYHFNTQRVRNISVDIRYVLFVIDKFADAGYLLNEMKIEK